MMRFQTVNPSCPPLSNAKKSNLKLTATMFKEDNSSNGNIENGRSILKDSINSTNTSTVFEGTKGFRFRSPSRTQDRSNSLSNSPPQTQAAESHHHEAPQNPQASQRGDATPNRCDVLLQWGQKKRARVSRSDTRVLTDDSLSSSTQARQMMGNKVQRRLAHAAMPPPSLASPNSRSSNLKNGSLPSKENPGFIGNRNLEEQSAAANGSPPRNSGGNRSISRSTAGKRSPPPGTADRKKSCSGSAKDEKQNAQVGVADHLNHVVSAPVQLGQETGAVAVGVGEKGKVGAMEWPRIYIALSRKEKEDDFLAMKGTKLPQRPKKRAKHIDRTLQYCFPGMWLSDLTKSRYEVREKKSVKKRRRGLKGMESMDSDSD